MILEKKLKNEFSYTIFNTSQKMNINKKVTLLILLWILDKVIMLAVFIYFKMWW